MREATPNRKPAPSLLHLIARGVVAQMSTTPRNAAGTDISTLLGEKKPERKRPQRLLRPFYKSLNRELYRIIKARSNGYANAGCGASGAGARCMESISAWWRVSPIRLAVARFGSDNARTTAPISSQSSYLKLFGFTHARLSRYTLAGKDLATRYILKSEPIGGRLVSCKLLALWFGGASNFLTFEHDDTADRRVLADRDNAIRPVGVQRLEVPAVLLDDQLLERGLHRFV